MLDKNTKIIKRVIIIQNNNKEKRRPKVKTLIKIMTTMKYMINNGTLFIVKKIYDYII